MRGEGPAVLFIHGFTLDHRMWKPQLDELSSRFRVIAYDVRGFGLSHVPNGPYRHCDDAAALLRSLGIERAVVVGHSMGAHQGLELALEYPSLVSGWVSIAGSALAGVPFPSETQAMFAAVRTAARSGDLDEAKRLWLRSGWFEGATPETLATVREYSGWHWLNDNPAQSISPPAAERLEELRVPALVVSGAKDLPYNTTIVEALAKRLRKMTSLRLERAGHMPNLDEPAAVNAAITTWMEKIR
jgi:pimeloyl-ACP methyl ester carboxylesterase